MENKPRKKWIAVLFTILTTGLGHIYCGRVKRGIIFILIPITATVTAFLVLKVYPSFLLLISFLTICIIYLIYCIFDVIKIAQKQSVHYETKKFNRWYIYLALYTIVIAIPQPLSGEYIKQNIVQAFKIPSGSMIPTLQIGDMLLAKTDKESKSNINRGDLIIFKYPMDRTKIYIKRVIAIEGETISIKDKKVSINHSIFNEPYIINTDSRIFKQTKTPRDNMAPIEVPANSFFVMGDNRDNTHDSRFWGFVKELDIIGKPTILYWSWDKKAFKIRFNRIGKSLI